MALLLVLTVNSHHDHRDMRARETNQSNASIPPATDSPASKPVIAIAPIIVSLLISNENLTDKAKGRAPQVGLVETYSRNPAVSSSLLSGWLGIAVPSIIAKATIIQIMSYAIAGNAI